MTTSYEIYTDIVLNAFNSITKTNDVIGKKVEIITSIINHYNTTPSSVLFFGFNPWLLSKVCDRVFVTEISKTARSLLDQFNIEYTYIDNSDLVNYYKQFQWIIAGDEYFTFASSELEQRAKVELLINLAKDLVVTSLRDYKNQDFKDREFSQPIAIRNNQGTNIFLEYNEYEFNERNIWKSKVYQIQNSDMTFYGSFDRASMYFKQLAKFSIDAGAQNFLVHKNLMYKSLIKKNYEHVISIPIK
jgi:hypothetical protein